MQIKLAAPRVFNVMAKPTGAACNLDCRYCYFLEKERLYPNSDFRMNDQILEAHLRQYIEAQEVPEVVISWQGGEPTLMGIDFFRRGVALAARFRKPGMVVRHQLQTNGMLLDDAWCALFREHGFLVGLSMDGPPEIHDTYRLDKAGRPTSRRVIHAAKLLQEHGVEHNVLVTVNAANAHRPLEVYRFLRDEVGARFLQLIPIVERVRPGSESRDGLVTTRSVTGPAWGQFLNAWFDEWVTRDVGEVFVNMFDATLGAFLGAPASSCVFAETCGDALALEHNGDLYACDHFVEPGYKLGNILDTSIATMVASEKQRAFGLAKKASLPRDCRTCPFLFACHGECPANRILIAESGEPGLNYLCAGYKAYFAHVEAPMREMAKLVREGRSAMEIMKRA